MNEGTRLVRVATPLLSELICRTDDGRRITATWGDPVETVGGEPVYEPTFTATDDGMKVIKRRAKK